MLLSQSAFGGMPLGTICTWPGRLEDRMLPAHVTRHRVEPANALFFFVLNRKMR